MEGMFFSSFRGIMVSHAPFLHFLSLFFKSTFFLEPQYSSFKSPLKPESYLKDTISYLKLFCTFVLFHSGLLPVKTFFLPSFSCEFYTPLSSFEAKSTPRSELGLLAGDLGLPRLADWGGVQVKDVKDHLNSCFLL